MKIIFGKQAFDISVGDDYTISHIKSLLSKETGYDTVRLISSGKTLGDETLVHNIPGGIHAKLVMIASHSQDIITPPSNIRIKDDLTQDVHQKQHPYSASRKPIKREFTKDGYGFHNIQTLPNLPDEDRAREILESLASDPGFLSVMKKHGWNVGSLGELYPEGMVGVSEVCVLGLNKNKGQEILLRIRTDDLKGFRKMLNIREVLCHELSHMIYSDHDDQFYMLMRQIQKEVIELDWTKSSFRTLGDVRSYSRWVDDEINDRHEDDDDNDRDKLSLTTQNNRKESKMTNIEISNPSNSIENMEIDHPITKPSTNIMVADLPKSHQNTNDINKTMNISDSTETIGIQSLESNHSDERIQAMEWIIEYHKVVKLIFQRLDESMALILGQEGVLSQDKLLTFLDHITTDSQSSLAISPSDLDLMEKNRIPITTISSYQQRFHDWKWSIELFVKIFSNAKDINDEKVRVLKKDTKSFQRLLRNTNQKAYDILRLGGFQDDGNTVKIKAIDIGFLYFATDILKSTLEPIGSLS